MEEKKNEKQNTSDSQLGEVISVNIICRICANQSDKLIGIYSEDGTSNELANKMNLYLPVKVSENDELPQQCCWQCASTVLAWHDLVITSVEAERRLRSYQFITEKQLEELQYKSDVGVVDELKKINEEPLNTSLNTFCTTNTSIIQNDVKIIAIDNKDDLESPLSQESDNYVNMPYYVASKKDDVLLYSPKPTESLTGECDRCDVLPPIYPSENNYSDESTTGETYSYACQSCPNLFLSEDEVLNHVKEEHSKSNDSLSETIKQNIKKEKRKNVKIDQDLVNSAKVVVDGRVYYNCKECGKSLHSPYTYVWHIRIHTGERPYVCDLCGKQFRVSQGLVRHLKETHERIKNFSCDLCGRMFATRRNVEEHRRIHTNERPYVCDLCGKSFKQKASLFVHNRSHNDTFPFKCSYCDQAFRTKPPLLIHITRHTGEKPYPCDVCGRCFRIKYELKRHRLIHSDEKPFACAICGLSFRQKRYLRNHNKLNHQSSEGS